MKERMIILVLGLLLVVSLAEAQPQDVQFVEARVNRIDFHFYPDNPRNFNIYRRTIGSEYSLIASVPSTSFEPYEVGGMVRGMYFDSTQAVATKYFYKVTSYDVLSGLESTGGEDFCWSFFPAPAPPVCCGMTTIGNELYNLWEWEDYGYPIPENGVIDFYHIKDRDGNVIEDNIQLGPVALPSEYDEICYNVSIIIPDAPLAEITLSLDSPIGDLTSFKEDSPTIYRFSLHQNYPNPFNPSTNISFDLAQQSFVNLSVFNSAGQKVATLLSNNYFPAGTYSEVWDATGLPGGIYFYQLSTETFRETKRMTLIK